MAAVRDKLGIHGDQHLLGRSSSLSTKRNFSLCHAADWKALTAFELVMGSLRLRSRCTEIAQIPANALDQNDRPVQKALIGMDQNDLSSPIWTDFVGLITRRSQVQILPPPPRDSAGLRAGRMLNGVRRATYSVTNRGPHATRREAGPGRGIVRAHR